MAQTLTCSYKMMPTKGYTNICSEYIHFNMIKLFVLHIHPVHNVHHRDYITTSRHEAIQPTCDINNIWTVVPVCACLLAGCYCGPLCPCQASVTSTSTIRYKYTNRQPVTTSTSTTVTTSTSTTCYNKHINHLLQQAYQPPVTTNTSTTCYNKDTNHLLTHQPPVTTNTSTTCYNKDTNHLLTHQPSVTTSTSITHYNKHIMTSTICYNKHINQPLQQAHQPPVTR